NLCICAETLGLLRSPSRHKAAPTWASAAFMALHRTCGSGRAREEAGKSTDKLSLFTQRIIPKVPLGLLLDIRPAQPQIMQGRIAEAGQLLALAVQLQPARRPLQGRMPQVVQGKGRLLDAADMTFHREA